jgi:diaminopimelate decarboxylase
MMRAIPKLQSIDRRHSRPSANQVTSFVLDRSMVEPNPGDLVAVMTAGAYGAVEAGTYNTRAPVAEVLVKAGEWALVRPHVRAEELIALDRLPAWL